MENTYNIETQIEENEEGSSFAVVTITFADGEQIVESFSSYFDSPVESAVVQASSFIGAFEEAEERRAEADRLGVHPLEIAFAPFGPEWEREMEERNEVPF